MPNPISINFSDSTKEPPDTDRRQDYSAWRANVERRLNDGAETMRGLRDDIAANTATTNQVQATTTQVQADTSELVSLLKSFQGAFAVLNMIGKAAKPLASIAMAASAVWALWVAFKSGGPPK